jgi:hypothetical protein
MSLDEAMQALKSRYHGYRWHPLQPDESKVFNPFDIISVVLTGELLPHWISSATSIHVVEVIGLRSVEMLKGIPISYQELNQSVSVLANEREEFWKQLMFQVWI